MTTYNPAIPQPSNLISNSQADILGNFGQLNSQFGIDHVAFNTGSGNGSGFHKKVTIPTPLGSDPTLTSTTGEYYTKQVSSVTYPFFANAASVWQLAGQKSATGNGYTTLPGGFILQWGNVGFSGSSTSVGVTFPLVFPGQLYNVCITPLTSTAVANSVCSYESATATGFTAFRNSGAVGGLTIYWIAIGI